MQNIEHVSQKTTILGKWMVPFSTFIRSKDYMLFSLLMVIAYFFQMYAKLGYMVTLLMFPGQFWVAVFSALFFALAASNITASVIVHNRNKHDESTSYEFLIFDVLISVAFYGHLAPGLWEKQDYGMIAVLLIFSIFTSRALFFLSELFRLSNVEEDKANDQTQTFITFVKRANQILGLDVQPNRPLPAILENLEVALLDIAKSMEHNAIVANQLTETTKSIDGLESKLTEANTLIDSLKTNLTDEQVKLQFANKEIETLRERYEELEAQRSLFVEDNSPERLRGTLKGKVSALTKLNRELEGEMDVAVRRKKMEKIKELQKEIEALKAVLMIQQN